MWRFLFLMSISVNIYATTLSTLTLNQAEPLIIADKTSGILAIYDPGSKTITKTPALFGKTISDKYYVESYQKGTTSNGITPSGEFISTKAYSSYLHEPITAFILGDSAAVAIHPVWLGDPKQKRPDRLLSITADDNRITNGCINIPKDFYFKVMDKLPTHLRVVILKEGDTLIDDVTQNTEIQSPELFEQQPINQYGIIVPATPEVNLKGYN